MKATAAVEDVKVARPFIKWVGGKRLLLDELRKHVPDSFGRYIEPFIGGGALFFDLCASKKTPIEGLLGDKNGELATTYVTIQKSPDALIEKLRNLEDSYRTCEDKKAFFYGMRATRPIDPIEVAARLIFLNKTCYNGLYRVNKSGGFNTPHGRYENPTICDAENILACSAALAGTCIGTNDFGLTASMAMKGDFVYFDPPYWPVNATSNFTSYTKDEFGPGEQERLRDVARALKKRGVRVLLSNADVEPVRALYADGFEMRRIEVGRAINSKATSRGKVGELLIW